ncbi:glycosyltransferase [Variovorax sp. LARHSF232]
MPHLAPLQTTEEIVLHALGGIDRFFRLEVSAGARLESAEVGAVSLVPAEAQVEVEARAGSAAALSTGTGQLWVRADFVGPESHAGGREPAPTGAVDMPRDANLGEALSRLVPPGQALHLLRLRCDRPSAVLAGNDLQAHRPWIIALAGAPRGIDGGAHDLLQSSGYRLVGALDAERIYVASERTDLVERLELVCGAAPAAGDPSADIQLLKERLAQAQRLEFETRVKANAPVRAREAPAKDLDDAQLELLAQQRAMMGSAAWRLASTLQRVSGKFPPPVRRLAKRTLRAAWWTVTPHRYGERWNYLRARWAEPEGVPQIPTEAEPPIARAGTTYGDWTSRVESRSALVLRAKDAPLLASLLLSGEAVEPAAVRRTVESLRRQSQAAWELIACAPIPPALRELAQRDARIRLVEFDGLAGALRHAKGQFIAFVDVGDVLAEHALNELAAALRGNPGASILYGDEDMLDADGRRTAPCFKPGWSPDLLFAHNYFGRLCFLRRELVASAGGLAIDAGVAFEWDLNLRCSDLTQDIVRIPKVLCHRGAAARLQRPAPGSSGSADHRAVLARYWARHGFEATIQTQPDGTQRAVWSTPAQALVSVIIPTKDKVDLLRMCVQGLLDRTDYDNKEIIIVDTGSTEPQTHDYYAELAANPAVRIVRFERRFNYSAACNYGAACAQGELLLFLNNDIEVVHSDWLAEMVRFAQRPGVGVVGTRLDYPTGELQHAGVGIGPHLCALMYRSAEAEAWGLFGSANHPRNWLAIMGACQLVRRDVFERVGGFDEAYLVAMSDVALCLQAWRLGYRTAYAPQARLIHHEGATRGKSNPQDDVRRIADDIRLLGIDDDPYLHPELDGHAAIPALRSAAAAPGPRQVLKERVAADGSIVLPVLALDLCVDGDCIAAAEAPRDQVLWLPQAAHSVNDKWSAARWCLDQLRHSEAIRDAFPLALSQGAQGDFPGWLREGGAAALGLGEAGLAAIEALFSQDLATRARQAFLQHPEVRDALPHGLTPAGRALLLRWFMRHGRADAGLRLEEVWWLLWQAAEEPAQELMNAWRFTPEWQRMYPDGNTAFGAQAFAAWFKATFRASGNWTDPSRWPLEPSAAIQIRQAYLARQPWRARFPMALHDAAEAGELVDWLSGPGAGLSRETRDWCNALDRDAIGRELVAPGVNVIGHFCYPSGLRVSVEALVGGLQQVGVQTSLRDIRTDRKDDPHHANFGGMEVFDATIIHTQPEPFFDSAYALADVARRSPRSYRIAYWYWEFDSIPESWLAHADQVDEVWAATEFVAKGLRERLSLPVRTLFPGVKLGEYKQRPREYFGLDTDKYTFLFTFHMMSIMERKNPLGLIRAFKLAFKPDEPVCLVLKTSFGDRHPVQIQELHRAAEGGNIKIIDAVYSPDEVLSIMDCCDAYVSLHRSEGLGLTMAEAMLMGKPVIATNFSGNVDFMNDDNSLLVPYKLEKLGRPIPPYDADFEWAEPSVEHAAKYMRRVFDDQAWAKELGARAKASALANLSLESAGHRVARRLEEIRSLRTQSFSS